jgi:outer membrane protein
MKKHLLIVACVVLGFAPNAFADKIGFVNLAKIYRESAPALKAQAKLQSQFEKRDKELQATGLKLQAMQDDLEKNDMTMKESEKRAKQREFTSMSTEFQRKQREFREDLNLAESDEMKGIQERVGQLVKKIAESEKYDLIVQDAVFWSANIDITDRIIKGLEAK